MPREINTLSDAIIQTKNWLQILTMDSEYNESLHVFKQQCFKEMSEFIKNSDSSFIAELMVRLTEKGMFVNIDRAEGKGAKGKS